MSSKTAIFKEEALVKPDIEVIFSGLLALNQYTDN